MQYDLFISYSHRDNKAPERDEKGWVDKFHVALHQFFTEFSGSEPNIFRDIKIDGYQRLTPTVYGALENTLLFVPVLSPNFLSSKWCPDELKYFVNRAMGKSGSRAQIFPVVKTPIAKVPPELNDHLLKYKYFTSDETSDELFLFNPDLGEDRKQKFYLKTSDLARNLADYMNSLPEKIVDVVTPPPDDRPRIYLAEPSPDLWDAYEDIKRDLEQRGEEFLPSDLMKDGLKKPADLELYKREVRTDIKRCRLSVNLVGGRSNGYPKASALTYQQLQMDVAAEKDGEADYKRLIWLPKEVQTDDEEQLAFLEGIRNSPAKGVEFLQGSLEEFKTSIQDALKPPALEPQLPEDDDPPWVYVLYDKSDLEPSRHVEDLLQETCAIFPTREYLEPALKGDLDVNVYERHKEWLAMCDAVLIYWNRAPSTWVINNIYELQKAKASRNGRKFRAKAIFCDGDGESERKHTFKSSIVQKVSGYSELPLFLSRLEVQFP